MQQEVQQDDGESPVGSSIASPCTPSTSSETMTTTESSCQSRGPSQPIQCSGPSNHTFCKASGSATRCTKTNSHLNYHSSQKDSEAFHLPHGVGVGPDEALALNTGEGSGAKVCDVETVNGSAVNDSLHGGCGPQKPVVVDPPSGKPNDRGSFFTDTKEGYHALGEQDKANHAKPAQGGWPCDSDLQSSTKGSKFSYSGGESSSGGFWGRTAGQQNAMHPIQQPSGDRCSSRRTDTNGGSVSECGSGLGHQSSQSYRMNNRGYRVGGNSFNEKGSWSFNRRRRGGGGSGAGGNLNTMSSGPGNNQPRGGHHGVREGNHGNNPANHSYYTKRNSMGSARSTTSGVENQGPPWKYNSRQGSSRNVSMISMNVQQIQEWFTKRSLNILYDYKEQESQRQNREGGAHDTSCHASIRYITLEPSQVASMSSEDFLVRLQQSLVQVWGTPLCSVNDNSCGVNACGSTVSGVHAHDLGGLMPPYYPPHPPEHSPRHFGRPRMPMDPVYGGSGYLHVGTSAACYASMSYRPPPPPPCHVMEGSGMCSVNSGGASIDRYNQGGVPMPVHLSGSCYALPRVNGGGVLEESMGCHEKSPQALQRSNSSGVPLQKNSVNFNGTPKCSEGGNEAGIHEVPPAQVPWSPGSSGPLDAMGGAPNASVQSSENAPAALSQALLSPLEPLQCTTQSRSLPQFNPAGGPMQPPVMTYPNYAQPPRFSQPYFYSQYATPHYSRQQHHTHHPPQPPSRGPHGHHQEMHHHHPRLPRYHNYTYQAESAVGVYKSNAHSDGKTDVNAFHNAAGRTEDEGLGGVRKDNGRGSRHPRHPSVCSGPPPHHEVGHAPAHVSSYKRGLKG